eukprot:TRINITY_DN10886_c0_g1_i3.p1 TRINITY_DN10886_c0_g1~~TRINITY_DN10886_c0_g1_i3.p1  ORF type:complete len:594 (-),score=72.91 TRINITY_DN10886_c0_g1_i3:1060-2841(-)
MRSLLAFATILQTLLLTHVGAVSFEVETGLLRILEPDVKKLDLNESYRAAIGDYGSVLYGGTLVGVLLYFKNENACEDIDTQKINKQMKNMEGNNFILLVQRGDCYFAQKTLYAQKAGAVATIIYNNEDGDDLITMASPSKAEDAEQAKDITISTMFITKKDGEQIIAYVTGNNPQPLVVEMDWTQNLQQNQGEKVGWDFWFSTNPSCGPSCDKTKDFIISFKSQAKRLLAEGKTEFTPHTVFRKCLYSDLSLCDNCIKGGRYCAYSHDNNVKAPMAVPEENLRSLCVYNTTSETQWWDYTYAVLDQCSGDNFNRNCSNQQLKDLYMDVAKVDACMGDLNADEESEIIERELNGMTDDGDTTRGKIVLIPTIVVNKEEQYRGSMDDLSVMRAICAGFKEGEEAELCLDPSIQYSTKDCEDDIECWHNSELKVYACKDSFRGKICECPQGWEGNGTQCTDIDECAFSGNKKVCNQHNQHCRNTPGSYECYCDEGYEFVAGEGNEGVCIQTANLSSPSPSKQSNPAVTATIVILVCIALIAASIYGYHYVQKRRVHSEVKHIVQQYMPLPDQPDEFPSMELQRSNHANATAGKFM